MAFALLVLAKSASDLSTSISSFDPHEDLRLTQSYFDSLFAAI